MNKRGAMSIEQLGIIVLSLIALAVIMLMIYPKFLGTSTDVGKKSTCELSILLGSISRLGGVERIPPECKANIINIDQKLISSQSLPAREELTKLAELKTNPDYKEVTHYFNDPSSEEQLTEIIANKIISKEMTSCWDKVVHGKLGMFDEWYNLFDLGPNLKPSDYKANKQAYADELISHWSVPGVIEKWGPPKFCIICSDITFGKDIKLNKDATSFTPWLKATPHWYYKDQSLYEFLIKDQNYNMEPYYNYKIEAGKQYAVVFERVNTHKLAQWYYGIKNVLPFVGGEDVPNSINRLVLTEYDNVVKPFDEEGGEACFKIID